MPDQPSASQPDYLAAATNQKESGSKYPGQKAREKGHPKQTYDGGNQFGNDLTVSPDST